jgi:tight adherence protein C
MSEMTPLLITAMAFISVAFIIFIVGRYVVGQMSMQRRLPVSASTSRSVDLYGPSVPNVVLDTLTASIDEKKFGIEGSLRTKLRRDLIRAGFFSDRAIPLYIFVRLSTVIVLPLITFIIVKIFFGGINFYWSLAVVGLSALLAVLGPDAYISRRQRTQQGEYRLVFPDLLDMLVVCIDAGLSLDAALSRIQPEVSKQSSALGVNLIILGAETRAGRSTTEALGTFADRLNLDEARSFSILLRQSLELGTDVSNALRVFSDEMRTKRILRAEETANKLPVKMVIPLGTLIFPVILILVLYPVIIRLLAITRVVG